MSKEISWRNFVTCTLTAALTTLLLLSGVGAGAQKARRAPAGRSPATVERPPASVKSAINPKTAAVREATAEVLRETSELRKLSILRPVQSGAQSRAEIEQMLIRNLNESTNPEEMRASELVLKKLGLAPADFQLRPFIIKLLVEQ